ncbi:MAG: hypothetical protein WDM96_04270 [Lacunisphaera sp.]
MEYASRELQPDEKAMDYAMLGGVHAQRGRQLFRTGIGLLIALLVYLAYSATVADPIHLFLGLGIFTLAIVPSLLWARAGGSRFPVFEVIMLLCANAYALPLLNAQEQLADFSPEAITTAGLTVLLHQVAAILTYATIKGVPGRSDFWRESLLSPNFERLMVYGLVLSCVYVVISTFTTWIPRDLESVLRAVFFGVSILCTFVSAQRWGHGELTAREKSIFLAAIIPQLFIMSVGLTLIAALSQIGIALLGYVCGSKRIPWVALIIIFPIAAVLHTGKTRMRTKYWEEGNPPPTLTQVPAYYAEWIDFGLQPTSGGKTVGHKIIERTSLMHMLCLIVSWSPDRQDYLYGKTYSYVLPQLIPRFFWPDKPRSHIATYELSIYYGLQAEEDTNSTTIAFGLLAEAYANFGLTGGVLLGLFWGFTLKKLQIWSTFSPMFSFAGLFMVLLTAWAFNVEMTMSVWVSSLQQAVVVALGLPLLVKSFFGS